MDYNRLDSWFRDVETKCGNYKFNSNEFTFYDGDCLTISKDILNFLIARLNRYTGKMDFPILLFSAIASKRNLSYDISDDDIKRFVCNISHRCILYINILFNDDCKYLYHYLTDVEKNSPDLITKIDDYYGSVRLDKKEYLARFQQLKLDYKINKIKKLLD